MNKLPRVSIVQCVSTALDMMKFSTDAIYNNSGYDNFDYVIVTWLPSEDVWEYLQELNSIKDNVHIVVYKTNDSIGYVPNLRAMMNTGFSKGFELNEYCGLVNTDMYFGKDWLINLVKYASEDTIVNSTHVTPINGPHVITANCGIPEYGKFNLGLFDSLYNANFKDELESEETRGGWMGTNTMPYLIHRKYWVECGPWELNLVSGQTPDRRFFQRIHEAGAIFTLSHSSIVYHHEAVERRGARPRGAEHLSNEP